MRTGILIGILTLIVSIAITIFLNLIGLPIFFFVFFLPLLGMPLVIKKEETFREPFSTTESELNYCPNCGFKLEGWENYCPKCGFRLR